MITIHHKKIERNTQNTLNHENIQLRISLCIAAIFDTVKYHEVRHDTGIK